MTALRRRPGQLQCAAQRRSGFLEASAAFEQVGSRGVPRGIALEHGTRRADLFQECEPFFRTLGSSHCNGAVQCHHGRGEELHQVRSAPRSRSSARRRRRGSDGRDRSGSRRRCSTLVPTRCSVSGARASAVSSRRGAFRSARGRRVRPRARAFAPRRRPLQLFRDRGPTRSAPRRCSSQGPGLEGLAT